MRNCRHQEIYPCKAFVLSSHGKQDYEYSFALKKTETCKSREAELHGSFAANSDLIKTRGDWQFNYDANGNMTARGKRHKDDSIVYYQYGLRQEAAVRTITF
jgi:YD repeat-containing protein